MIYRNWLIEGLALFLLGYYIHYRQKEIKISNKILLAIIIVSSIMCIIERILIGRDFGINIFTFPQVIALFIFAVKNPNKFKNSKLCILGTKCSMLVYLLHPLIWHCFEYMYKIMKINENIIALYLMPVIIVIVTILISLLINNIISKIQSRKETVND